MAEIKMDISEQILKVYTQIANWHNNEQDVPNKTNLQMLSHEIVADIINFTLSEMNVKTKVGVEVDESKLPKRKKSWFWKK